MIFETLADVKVRLFLHTAACAPLCTQQHAHPFAHSNMRILLHFYLFIFKTLVEGVNFINTLTHIRTYAKNRSHNHIWQYTYGSNNRLIITTRIIVNDYYSCTCFFARFWSYLFVFCRQNQKYKTVVGNFSLEVRKLHEKDVRNYTFDKINYLIMQHIHYHFWYNHSEQ